MPGARPDGEDRPEASRGRQGWSPLGRALLAYQRGRTDAVLRVHREDGVEEELPAALFFRGPDEMDRWERRALREARGRVLDVGAGAGAHALALQERGREVVALEALPGAVRVLRERGVGRVVEGSLHHFVPEEPFDTVLLLMSGSSLAGTLEGLGPLFDALDRVTAAAGQVLLDSTDLREPGPGGGSRADGRYVGELHYQLEFDGERGPPFPHLFVDPDLLHRRALRAGWVTEVLWRDDRGRFLARMMRDRAAPGTLDRTRRQRPPE